MLLTIDIGNTNFTLGVFREEELVATFRMTTKSARTSDEYAMIMLDLLNYNKVAMEDISDVIIASVVPNIMHSMTSACVKYLNAVPIIVQAGIRTGIRVVNKNPQNVGADRIVDAAAAYGIYGGPVIVIDYGTATTFDLVTEDGAFTAGVTAPGIRSSAQSLWANTAKLPEFEIVKPESILAHDTITSMQAGVVYGQIGQTEYIVNQMKKESGLENIKVVATGGLGVLIERETDVIDVYDPNLTLQGLRLVFEKQGKK